MSLSMHLWSATALVGVAALLALALDRAPARTRGGVWSFASLQFLVPLAGFAALGSALGAWMAPAVPGPMLRIFEQARTVAPRTLDSGFGAF